MPQNTTPGLLLNYVAHIITIPNVINYTKYLVNKAESETDRNP